MVLAGAAQTLYRPCPQSCTAKSCSAYADFHFVTGLLTADGRRHVRLMLRRLAPRADRLEQRFRAWLSKAGYETAHSDTLLSINPAASRCQSVNAFLNQVQAGGRRLAKWNLPLSKLTGPSADTINSPALCWKAASPRPASSFCWLQISC